MFDWCVYFLLWGISFLFWIYLKKSDSKAEIENVLNEKFKTLNEKQVLDKLLSGYKFDSRFHLRVPTKLRYVARKSSVPEYILNQICQDLLDENIDHDIQLILSQTIKYSVKNDHTNFQLEKLLDILEKNQDKRIRSEIVWTLAYQIGKTFSKNADQMLDENLVNKINSAIEKVDNEISSESMNFLNEQIRNQYYVADNNHLRSAQKRIKLPVQYSQKLKQAAVTKNQQTIKVKLKNKQSEESTDVLSSVDLFKNIKKDIKTSTNTEILPSLPDKYGSDQSMLRTTREEIINLYNRIKAGQILKKADKDEYLPSRFLGPDKKWFLTVGRKYIESLYLDQVISEIFLEISKKQMLNNPTICLLMECIDDLDGLEQKILGGPIGRESAIRNYAFFMKTVTFTLRAMTLGQTDIDIDIDEDSISERLTSQLKNIRMNAISAIYNCMTRNKGILTDDRLNRIQKYIQDDDSEFKNWILEILLSVENSKSVDYEKVFHECLRQIEQDENIMNAIKYIYEQSKDENRCKELFDEDSIAILSSMFNKQNLGEDMKLLGCSIINNYLQRSYTKGLNEIQFRNYIHLIDDSQHSEDLKLEALRSIVLTVEKDKDLPTFVMENLLKNINRGDDKFDNFVILVLGIASVRQAIFKIDCIASRLVEDTVIIRDEAEIHFEQSSQDNEGCQFISSIVAQMFVTSLQKNIRINDQSIERLVEALASKDKQTCILSAKALYLAAETHEIKDMILFDLKEHIENRIYDVSVFSTVAYIRGLVTLSSSYGFITTSHVNYLPKIYVSDDLILGEENFTDIVNKKILFLLYNEAANKPFEDDVFRIFDHNLLFENVYQVETIEILRKYSANKFLIPTDTIIALENVITTPELSNRVLKVFENMIYNKQIISEKVLRIFVDNFYLSQDDHLRENSYHLLSIANDNQDISEGIFNILELEKASLAISADYLDAKDAIIFLQEQIKKGHRLTITSFQALTKVINIPWVIDENILKILLNASNNGQIIPHNLVGKLIRRFDPKKEQYEFIRIFENLVKNNQEIPKQLLSKLSRALDNPRISDQVLSIFVLEGQKGKKLSAKVIHTILDKFLNTENPFIIQQYLSVICSVIEKKDYFEFNKRNIFDRILYEIFGTSMIPHIQTALLHALKIDNQDIIRKSINGFKTLVSLHEVDLENNIIDTLLSLLTNDICDENLREEIRKLLKDYKLDEEQICTYELAYINAETNDELLNKLAEFDKPKLLMKNFDQISRIIDNDSTLHVKALNILLQCSNKKNIPDKLLDSISILLTSTNSTDIKSLCLQLIADMIVSGRIMTNEIISFLLAQDENDKSIEILKLIEKNQLLSEELQNKINLLSNINLSILEELLNSMQQQYKKNQTFSHLLIQKLVSFEIPRDKIDNNLEQKLIDIYALILIEHPQYSSNLLIIDYIEEKAILTNKLNKNILDAYKEVIKITKCQTNNFQKVLNVFIDILNQNDTLIKFHFDILVCIVLASEVIAISNLDLLENDLFNDNEIIRSWSFRGLRAAYNRGVISFVFNQWCDDIIKKLKENTDVEVDLDLDLLETISALKCIDFNKIRGKPQNQWNREFLIFDLIGRFQISQTERFQFYKTWLDVEEHRKNQSDILLKLLHRQLVNNTSTLLFNDYYETIKILDKIDFETVHRILLNSNKVFVDLRKAYLILMINERLPNKNVISCEYIESLAWNMIVKFGFNLSEKFLDALQTINNLREFEATLNFAEKNHIQLSDIYVKNVSISILKRTLEIKFLGNQIKDVDRLKLGVHIDNLLDKNWTFEQLNNLFSVVQKSNCREKTRYFLAVLEIMSHYKISPKEENYKKLCDVLMNSAEDWQKLTNEIAVEINFSDKGQVKTSRELVQELENLNSQNQNLGEEKLLDLIGQIKNLNLFSRIINKANLKIPITQWTENHIRQWATIVKNNVETCQMNSEEFIIEALAVIKQANFIDTEFHLTDAQIISCLIVLNASTDHGRLLQVGTGEGKSTIISVLAVFYALQGKTTVDIITSSPVLAERDAKEKEKFYAMFALQCAHNNDKAVYLSGPKTCYYKSIVYGEAAQFQFDTLRTEYAELNTLANRKCDVAIVDEVDSMLIDDSSKIARLASSMSGMDQLQIIYHLIWNQIISLQEKIIGLDNKMYLFYGKIKFEEKRIILEYANEQGDIVRIPDLKTHLASTSDISEIGVCIPEDKQGDIFIKNHLDKYIRNFIEKNLKIPKNFCDFVSSQIPKWIDNAITALIYQENVHYIVHDGLIKPVDYYSTGIVQSSSNWSDGLHQFLQLKHELKMTSETLTTNFLSNRGYFTRYGSKLFGLTGTLGSDKAKQVLADVYKVDFVIIPSLRQKQHLSLPDIVVINEKDWLKEICYSAINESSKKRGTLIICETIEHSKIIGEKLQQKYRSSAIKLYTMNDMNQEKNVKNINPGEIIIATNLAGRGTDIKTDEIEKFGGLHVIVTFMPSNKRVEEQAFGRTSRQGKRGTSQRILNAINLTYYEYFDIQKISQLRDRIEAKMLSDFEESELKVITLKDELFFEFCSLLKQIRMKIREKIGCFTNLTNTIKSTFVHVSPSVLESNVLLSIEERWAMFLRNIDNEKLSVDRDKIHIDFKNFRSETLRDYENDCVIKNPYHLIVIGNDLIMNDSSINTKYDEAMKYFDRAIDLDPHHCAAAFVGRGWLLIKGKEKIIGSNEQEFGYKEAATRTFQRALEILAEDMALLTGMQTLLQQRSANTTSPLFKQLVQKVNILGSYCNSLENTINAIKRSRRLIQITEIIDDKTKQSDTVNSGVLQRVIFHNDIEKGIGKWCDIRLIDAKHVNRYKRAIEDCEEIFIVQKDEDKFTVVYKHKIENKIEKWTVDDVELNNRLLRLSFNESILDRNENSKIYDRIYRIIKSKNGYIRADFLAPLQTLPKNRECEITFNDLTVREDMGTIDQAIEIINQAISTTNSFNIFSRKTANSLNDDYQDVSIRISKINADVFKEFINPNIEIQEAIQQVALAQLKDKSSFFHRHLLPDCLSPDSYEIDLDVIRDNQTIRKESRQQARDAIKLIEQDKDDSLHFNLTFIAANEIYKVLKTEILNQTELTLEYMGLNGDKVLELLRKIISKSVDLEIFDIKENLLKVLSSVDVTCVELCSLEKEEKNVDSIKELADKTTAEIRLNTNTKNVTVMKLIDLNKSTIEKIIPICLNAKFNLHFISVTFECLLQGLNDELINVQFNRLGKKTAPILIEQIRKKNLDFSLIFKHLTSSQAQKLIEIAPIEQENIEINKVKILSELFMNDLKPDLELSEFSGRGIEYLLEISEKRFVPWLSVISVAIIGVVQIAVGAVLICTGFGATVGMGLVTEGASDLFTAYRAYSTRQFSWTDYGKQKAVSLIISAVSMGFSSIKDAAKGIQTVTTGIGQEAVEQAGTRLITGGKSAATTLIKTGKNLKGLAVKFTGVTVGETVLREGLNKVIDIGSNVLLEQMKPQISASIQNRVISKFAESDLLKIVRKMYAIDLINQKQQLEEKINRIVIEIINPEHSFWRKQWDSIGGPLCRGMLSSVGKLRSPVSMGIRIMGTLNGMYEITIIIQTVHDKLLKKLIEIDRETLSMYQILNHYCTINKEETREILNLLKDQDIGELNDELENKKFPAKLNAMNINKFSIHKKKIVTFLTLLHENISKVEINDFNKIMKLVSDTITEQIFRITQSQLISPWSTYGMGELTKAISERVQHHFIVDESQNSDSQNRENKEKGLKTTGSGQYNTIANQIRYNAKDYMIAYSQCEIIHYSQQQQRHRDRSHTEKIDDKTKEYIEGVRTDKPANLSDMMALAADYGLDIKIVDDADYPPTEEDKAKGTNIIVFTQGTADVQGKTGIGHFQLILQDGTIIDLPGEKNNCGYSVIQKILKDRDIEKSIDDLRNDRAQSIEDNPQQFSKADSAQRWIETRHPQQANSLLMVGGAKHPQVILDDPKLPNRENLRKRITETNKIIETYNATAAEEDKIKFIKDLEFILDDLNNEKNAEVISRSRLARNIFYSSISRRMEDFIEKNRSVLNQCPFDVSSTIRDISSHWKDQVHVVNPNIHYSQANLNANFSSDSSGCLAGSVGHEWASQIQGQRVDEQGKEFIKTHGASTLPVTVFLDETNRLVTINNRGLLAHELAGKTPNRILFVEPSETERNRLNRDGMPSTTRPSFDKND